MTGKELLNASRTTPPVVLGYLSGGEIVLLIHGQVHCRHANRLTGPVLTVWTGETDKDALQAMREDIIITAHRNGFIERVNTSCDPICGETSGWEIFYPTQMLAVSTEGGGRISCIALDHEKKKVAAA